MFLLLLVFSAVLAADDSTYDLTACTYTECHGMLSTSPCPSEFYLIKWDKCGFLKKKELCCRQFNNTITDKCRWSPCHSMIESNFCSKDEFVSEEKKCSLLKKQEKCCKQEKVPEQKA